MLSTIAKAAVRISRFGRRVKKGFIELALDIDIELGEQGRA